ncbi:YqjF family protein [Cytophaga aurantiaca]|uniref:YqjF family protein n=1 Tax=Cytophaga aurantiaca TaxID=29530 RepID=UPI000380967A|nr:DUF2071 domain-containing protein [Cytophaga aurantiaca]
MPTPFLTAQWKKLILANYAIDPEVLKPYVPAGTELDLWNDTCYVSVVGFLFDEVKVKGFSIFGHKSFPEVNLRFYVRRFEDGEWKRGVVFIKEIVPKRMITIVANTIYGEKYQTLPMRHQWDILDNEQRIEYEWKVNNKWNYLRVKTGLEPVDIKEGSEAEFITEHYWGYTKRSETKTSVYEVVHPRWKVYRMHNLNFSFSTKELFGEAFVPYLETKPTSIFLAEGSEIAVMGDGNLKY